jgi:anaerobic selenocysteine-containing dehydrogenase
MTNLARNLTELDDPPVRGLFVYGANPVVSNPDTDAVRRGLLDPDLFTVVVDVFPTETVDYADIVLPSTLQHEHYEINDSFAHLYLSLNQPAVEPPGACLPHTEIFRRLARELGLDDPSLQASDRELAAALLDTDDFRAAGITVERLEADGWARLPGTEAPFVPLATGFPTPSGRFEFTSATAERAGHQRLPLYQPGREAGAVDGAVAGRYDLIAAASDRHINSVFAGTEVVQGRAGEPSVRINPADGVRDGLRDGDRIEVGNNRGSFEATVRFDPGVRSGVAATTKGWWRMGLNATVAERDADMGRGAVYHDNRVRLRAVGAVGPTHREAEPPG